VAPDEVLGVKKDPTTWSLPFDRVYGGPLLRLQVYASDILVDQCMSNAGFDDFEVLTISSAPFPETQPHGNATLFNVEIAQKYGYRMAPDPGYKPSRENIDLHGGGYYDNKPEAFKNQLYTCQDEVQLELSGPRPTAEVPVDEGGNIPIESQLNRFTVDTSSPQLQEAAAQWRTCMAPQGIADLPQEPWATEIRREMPESLQTRLNFQLTGQPSADEIAVATADAQCRESSGWTSLLYEATWNQQAAWGSAQQAQQSQQPQQWGGQQQPSYGGQQQWAPKQPASGFGAIFDFGFKGSLLKGGLGSVYMASTIAVGVIVVFTIFKELTAPQGYVFSGGGSSVAVGQILWGLFAPVGAGLIALILIRALLEALASVVKKSDQE